MISKNTSKNKANTKSKQEYQKKNMGKVSGNAIAAWILGTLAVISITSLFIVLIIYLVLYRDCKLYCKVSCDLNKGTPGNNPPGANLVKKHPKK